jgi:hypothetical protein
MWRELYNQLEEGERKRRRERRKGMWREGKRGLF